MAELLLLLDIMMLPKNISYDLTEHLSHKEFKCRCERETCHYTLVNRELTDSFETLRQLIDRPLTVNSGYRCAFHNADKKVGGRPTSNHTRGSAIDISLKGFNEKERATIIYHANDLFDYVKVYQAAQFIHCQINE